MNGLVARQDGSRAGFRSTEPSSRAQAEGRSRRSHTCRAVERITLALILLLATILRIYRLSEVPLGLCLDEVMNGSLGRDVLNGRLEVYFEEGYGHEPLYHYLQALTIQLWGFNIVGIRLPSIPCGLALILLVWWLARKMFDPTTALVAAGGLAAGWWGVFYSRVGIRAITSPMLLTAGLIGFWWGIQASDRRRWLAFGLGGLALGLSLYTYPAARVVVWLPLLIALHLLLFDRTRLLRRVWKPTLLYGVIAILVATPIVVYLATHREERVTQLAEPLQRLRQGDVSLVGSLTRDTLLMPMGLKGDPRYLYNLSGRPIWEWPWATLFLGGFVLAIWRWRRPEYAALVMWFLLGLLPGMVTPDAPNTIRTIAALPAVYLLASLPASALIRWFRRPFATVVISAAMTALILWHGIATWRDMERWADDFEAQWRYQTPLFMAARVLDTDADAAPVCISFPWYAGLAVSSFDAALSRQDLITRWYLGNRSLLFPNGRNDCRYLYTDATDPDPALHAGWLAQAELIASEQRRPDGRPFYRFYRLPAWDIQQQAIEWTQSSKVYLGETSRPTAIPSPAHWSGGVGRNGIPTQVDLLGYRWMAETWQPGAEVTLLTMWQVNAPGDPELTMFAHLLDAGGQYICGEDRLDVPAHTWQPGDIFVQVQRLRLPAELPPGNYWPEVGIYYRDSGERLPIILDGAPVADRVLLDPVRVPGP
jgi:4-amino-4-deoxy-L-arabinose transferase-like glycosyltransferase